MTSGHSDVIVASQGGVMVTRLPILGSVAIGVHDNDQKNPRVSNRQGPAADDIFPRYDDYSEI
jgi:hypothetical protein